MSRPTRWLLLLPSIALGCQRYADPGQAPLRRLTPTEYNHTVRDLYGFDDVDAWPEVSYDDDELPAWPFVLPAEIRIHGFEGMLDGQVPSPYLVERYQAAALHFGALATQAPHFWQCEARDEACAAQSIETLANRAWRRSLTDAERRRLKATFSEQVAAHGLDDAITITVAGVLSAPQFIHHLEQSSGPTEDGREALADWTMASRLSYFLWDSMPDPALFAAASTGELRTAEQIEAQARRMWKNRRAREAVVHFHRQWLDLERVHSTRADLDTYAARYAPDVYSPEVEGEQEKEEVWSGALLGLRAGMVKETELFVEQTVFVGEGTLAALLTDNHGYVTQTESYLGVQTTAAAYGQVQVHDSHSYSYEIDDGNLGFTMTLRPATFPADQRAGLLTQGAVLAGYAHPVHPAPVLRGKFLLEQLTCRELGQPPAGAEGLAPPDTLDVESTNRERLQAVTSSEACIGCHQNINPAGFAFENYDSMGGWRDTDNGLPVDASGSLSLPGEGPVSFNNGVELAHKLARSRTVHDCYALQWTRYALGRELTVEEDPMLKRIQDTFWWSGGDVEELLVAIVKSPLFRSRTPEEGS